MESPQTLPRWALGLVRFLPLKSQFLLNGNVRDRYPWPIGNDRYMPLPLTSFLAELLRSRGIEHVLSFDPFNGFIVPLVNGITIKDEHDFFAEHFELSWNDRQCATASVARLFELLPSIARFDQQPIAVLADFSSRYLVRPDIQSDDEHNWFTTSLILSLDVSARPCGLDRNTGGRVLC